MFSLDNAGASLRSVCEAVNTGSLSPQVAAAHALIAGGSVKDAIDLVDAAPGPSGVTKTAILSALREHTSKCDGIASFYRLRGLLPAGGLEEQTVLETARFFDDALGVSPHASVALASLGNSKLLRLATDEVLAYLQNQKLLGPRKRTLELGCGNGRMQFALAPHVLEATGVDVSEAMIAAARKQRGGLSGVRFFHAAAHRVASLRDAEYDLVFAVDSFPYIVNAGPVTLASTFAEIRRVVRTGGQVFIFNFSNRGDENADMADVSANARATGLEMVSFRAHAFRHWDGDVFHLRPAPQN